MTSAKSESRAAILSWISLGLITALLFSGSGCSTASNDASGSAKPAATSPKVRQAPPVHSLTKDDLKELDEVMNQFADQFVGRLFFTTEELLNAELTPEQHRVVLLIRFHHPSAVYAVVSSPNPMMQMLDAVAQTALYRARIVDRGQGKKYFGDKAASLEEFYTWAERETLRIAQEWLTPEQQTELGNLIEPWVQERSQEPIATHLRMESFSRQRAGVHPSGEKGKGLFSGIRDAQVSIDESRMLAERAFFYLQRLPPILYARTEMLLSDLMNSPRLTTALESVAHLAETAQAVSIGVSNQLASLEIRLLALPPALLRSPEIVRAVDRIDQANSNLLGVSQSVRELDASVKVLATQVRQFEDTLNPETIGKVLASHTDAIAKDLLSEARSLVWLATGCVAGLIALAFILKLIVVALSRRPPEHGSVA